MITATAIRIGDRVFTGRGHGSVGSMALDCGFVAYDVQMAVYGFITDKDVFLDRDEAYEEALSSGQITEEDTSRSNGLFSEDLWDDLNPLFRELEFKK